MTYTLDTIEVEKSFIITTKEGGTYRRSYTSKAWEELLGESWETCYMNEDSLEAMFQEWALKMKDCVRKNIIKPQE